MEYSKICNDNKVCTKEKPKLLLHSCCGPCSTAVIERLLPDYRVSIFFDNSNITDREEYILRRDAQLIVIARFNEKLSEGDKIEFLEGNYNAQVFLEMIKGLEKEPEGGKRCDKCFEFRLRNTAVVARSLNYDLFGTTLTVSPHKNYKLISEIGQGISAEIGIKFLDLDFKKKAGFQRSIQLSKEFDLYRQQFCGCQFSK